MKSVNDWNLVESQTNSWPHYQWSPSDQWPVLPQDPVSASPGGCRGGAVAVAVESEEEVNCKSISTLTSPPPHHRTRRWLPEPLSVFTQLLRVLFCQI